MTAFLICLIAALLAVLIGAIVGITIMEARRKNVSRETPYKETGSDPYLPPSLRNALERRP